MDNSVKDALARVRERLAKLSASHRTEFPRWTLDDMVNVHIVLSELETRIYQEENPQ